MATKLKNLRIKKVDFVDEGANPDAQSEKMGWGRPQKRMKRKNLETY